MAAQLQATLLVSRTQRFKTDYSNLFGIYVAPLLYVSPRLCDSTPATELYNKLARLVSDSRNSSISSKPVSLATEFSASWSSLEPLMANNAPFVSFILGSMPVVSVEREPPPTTAAIRDRLAAFATLFVKSQALLMHDHPSLLILSWWFSQFLEIATMVYLVSLPGNEQGAGGSAKSSVGAIIEVFVKHTSVALYLLSGAYMIELLKEEAATAHVVSGSPSELFVNLREKSRAHSSMVRRYAHEALRGPKYQDLPSIFDIDSVGKDELGSDGSLIASVPKQIRKLLEKSLLDPGFDPIFLLCQLKLVKETNDLLGMSIVRYYGGQNRLFSLLRLSIAREVEATPTQMQLFRGESVATKLLYYYFYSTHGGLNYLRSLVLPLLNDFENSGFENANIATSDMDEDTMSKLLTISATFIRNIFSSLDRVPISFRVLFSYTQAIVAAKFPEMRVLVVGSFFFLRFLCPAVVTPEKFALHEMPSRTVRRGLISMGKMFQNIANGGVLFEDTQAHLTPMNAFILKNLKPILTFFEQLGDITNIKKRELQPDDFESLPYFGDVTPQDLKRDRHHICSHLFTSLNEITDGLATNYPNSDSPLVAFSLWRHPSILLRVFQTKDSNYAQVLRAFVDSMPDPAWELLLGLPREVADETPLCHFPWFHAAIERVQRAERIMKVVRYHRKEMQSLINHLLLVNQSAEELHACWPTSAQPSAVGKVLTRKLYFVLYHLKALNIAPVPFSVPELLEAWQSFLALGRKVLALLFQQVQLNYKHNAIAKGALAVFMAQLRWTTSRIVILETVHNTIDLKA